MRVLVCCDSFKGTMDAERVCGVVGRGVRGGVPGAEVDVCPASDGGEGFAGVVTRALGGALRRVRVSGPMGGEIEVEFGLLDGGRRAVLDAAGGCGLGLVPEERRSPGRVSSRGVGEAIAAAVGMGAREVVLGVGGTATVDGGVGVLAGLGGRAVDDAGGLVEAIGARLGEVRGVEIPEGTALEAIASGRVVLIVAVDVWNPLLGPRGTAAVYGPQKGASADEVGRLEDGLTAFARSVGRGVERMGRGMGAAGGMSFGLAAVAGAEVRGGFEVFAEAAGLEGRLRWADAVLTGEGCVDGTSASGKVVGEVVGMAVRVGRPAAVVAGRVGGGGRGGGAGGGGGGGGWGGWGRRGPGGAGVCGVRGGRCGGRA